MRIISKQRHLTSGVYIPDAFRPHLPLYPQEVWDVYFMAHPSPLVVVHIYHGHTSQDPCAAVQDNNLLGALEAALKVKGNWRATLGSNFRIKIKEVTPSG